MTRVGEVMLLRITFDDARDGAKPRPCVIMDDTGGWLWVLPMTTRPHGDGRPRVKLGRKDSWPRQNGCLMVPKGIPSSEHRVSGADTRRLASWLVTRSEKPAPLVSLAHARPGVVTQVSELDDAIQPTPTSIRRESGS